jgi:hypothetical protein
MLSKISQTEKNKCHMFSLYVESSTTKSHERKTGTVRKEYQGGGRRKYKSG